MEFDYVIVGGGSAGCVLANRLSATPANRVLLIEAGRDTPPDNVPDDIGDIYTGRAMNNPAYRWMNLQATFPARADNELDWRPRRHFEQGRVMGGSSSINGQIASRGLPGDYDEWVALGAAGWGWEDVLPYFKKLERDEDFDGPLHGKDGPIPVRRLGRELWPGFMQAAARAMEQRGFRFLADSHAEFTEGYFSQPLTNAKDRRVSSAVGFLTREARARNNLTILANSHAEIIETDGLRVTGVSVRTPEGRRTIAAREAIIAAGALQSPAVLLRSGIGPGAQLGALGIAPVLDLPAVGKNLMDHPAVSTAVYMTRAGRMTAAQRRHMIVGLRYSSGYPGCAERDMFLVPFNRSAWHALGWRIANMMTTCRKPYSRSGEVVLTSPDPAVAPRVDFNLLSDARDTARLKAGVRMVYDLCAQEPLKSMVLAVFTARYSDMARKYNVMTGWNNFQTQVAGIAMDACAPVRRLIIENMIAPGPSVEALQRDDALLEDTIRRSVHTVFHPTGTCRMGRAGDRNAVTDSRGRVQGMTGLRVCDASIMPVVPRSNTNLPTMMVAERMADLILQDAR